MNTVTLIGRLTADVEVSYTQSQTAVAKFNVAINRPVKAGSEKQADFPRCIAFGKTAENMEKFTEKGKLIAVQGRIQTGSYDKQDGTKVYTTDVIADRVEFLEWKDGKPKNVESTPQNGVQEEVPNFESIDEDIPF